MAEGSQTTVHGVVMTLSPIKEGARKHDGRGGCKYFDGHIADKKWALRLLGTV